MYKKINNAISKLENIVDYHNKNLTKKQYYDLQEILETLKEIRKSESEQNKMNYEMIVLFDNSDYSTMSNEIEKMVEEYFEIKNIEEWGNRTLAYPVKNKRNGYYIFYNLSTTKDKKEIDDFVSYMSKLQDEENKILKFILVKM